MTELKLGDKVKTRFHPEYEYEEGIIVGLFQEPGQKLFVKVRYSHGTWNHEEHFVTKC